MRKNKEVAKLMTTLVSIVALSTGCPSDTSCRTSAECFQGEVCVSGTCGPPGDEGDGGANNGGHANNGSGREDGGNNGSGDNNGASGPDVGDDGGSGTNNGIGPQLQCVVDPFGNMCTDDAHEPNDSTTVPPLLFDNQSWCTGSELLPSQTSEALQLCAADERDIFRLMIDNRNPNNCLTQQFTWKVEVRFKTPCEPNLLHVQPYRSNPFTEDRCADDENFRCGWSDDGQTFTIEEVRQPEQILDLFLLVEPVDARTDIQVEYDVVMTLTR